MFVEYLNIFKTILSRSLMQTKVALPKMGAIDIYNYVPILGKISYSLNEMYGLVLELPAASKELSRAGEDWEASR